MAKDKSAKQAPPVAKGGSTMIGTLAAFFLVALIAAGAGGYQGFASVGSIKQALDAAAKVKPDETATAKYPASVNLRELAPIVTNLALPDTTWVRLEASVVFDPAPIKEIDILLAEISGDLLAELRTLSLAQIQGASGLQHLRQDLTERISIRSRGRIRELIIHSLVLQ